MVTRRTLKRTAAGLLLVVLGTLATGCDELPDSIAKAEILAERPMLLPLGGGANPYEFIEIYEH